jgi:hypothetical protein
MSRGRLSGVFILGKDPGCRATVHPWLEHSKTDINARRIQNYSSRIILTGARNDALSKFMDKRIPPDLASRWFARFLTPGKGVALYLVSTGLEAIFRVLTRAAR